MSSADLARLELAIVARFDRARDEVLRMLRTVLPGSRYQRREFVVTGSAAQARFERVQAAIAAGRSPAPDDARWFLKLDANEFQAGSASLDEARKLIAELAKRFVLTSDQAYECIARYDTTAWRRERLLAECPPQRIGRPEEFAWKILRSYGRTPSSRTIRRILEEKALAKSRGAMATPHS